ncbi:MAG TPA: phasin family protein [Gemmatimonadaceae bacterium]|nr:phasin family protein [Gemmatimonadaceae bacterium]
MPKTTKTTKSSKSTKIATYTPKEILATTAEKAQETAAVVKETAQNIFLAGLGALTLAEDEGSRVFKALVKRGTTVDTKNKKAFSAIVKDVEARVEVVKENVTDATSGTVEMVNAGVQKIGDTVESGMASVMHTLGVPTRSEIQTLTRKVDALTKTVEHKAKSAEHKAKSAARKPKSAHKAPGHHEKKAAHAAASGTPAF